MAINGLLQHELDRFGVVTVMDVTLFDKLSGKPVLFLDTLKMSNITAEGQQKDIKGGRYADLLLTYNFGRSVSIEFQDALLSMSSMQEIWGATVSEGTVTFHDKKNLTVSVGLTVDTGRTALTSETEIFSVYNAGVEVPATSYTLAAGVITFTTGAASGDIVTVHFLNEVTTSVDYNPMQAVLKSSSFPKTVKLVGRTFILEQRTGQQVEIEIEIPKLKLASNFTMSLDAEGDASVFDFSGMALIDGADKEIFKVKTLGYSDVVNA